MTINTTETSSQPTEGATEKGTRATAASGRSRLSTLKKLLILPILAFGLAAAPAVLPKEAPVPQAMKAQQADASVQDCFSVATNTFRVTRGNLYAAVNAFASTRGCGNTNAGAICYASRQWWGGWARWVVSSVTSGRYNRC